MKVLDIVLTSVAFGCLLTLKNNGSHLLFFSSFMTMCFIVSLLFIREVNKDNKILVTLAVGSCGLMASLISPQHGIFFTAVSGILSYVVTISKAK